jgi:hypothetical protein
MLANPKGKRTGKTRTEPTSITPIDLESGRGYDGPGQVVGPDSVRIGLAGSAYVMILETMP